MEKKTFLREFLNFYWLRPENALMLYQRSLSYRKTLRFLDIKNDSIDISCGDGVFSFLTFGGQLSADSDMFRSIKYEKNISRKIDNFDFYDDDYFIKVKKKPIIKYSHGIDLKINLLKKAHKLNFYTTLQKANNNYRIPFPDNKFSYAYSNSTYWIKDYNRHINDIIRITKKNGIIVLQIKNNSALSFKKNFFYKETFGNRFIKIIDAGRYNSWKFLKSITEINNIFKNNKEVELLEITPIYGNIIPEIWNFGLRPIFQPLSKMVNNLNKKNRAQVKEEFIEIIFNLFEKYITNYNPGLFSKSRSEIEYTYVLRKK